MNDTIAHRQWMALAAEEYRRLQALLGGLHTEQWAAPTDCPPWTVREIVAHLAGAAEATASVREQLRQQRLGSRTKGDRLQIDAVNELQVRERAEFGVDELLRRFADAARRGVRARTRMPAPVRALRFRFPPPVGWASLGYLNDIVYTRDAWMHRIDICRAIGTDPELTPDHDGRIVADAARAWLRATGAGEVTLTGAAGTTLAAPNPAAAGVTFDAVEFARALSGRAQLPGVAADVVLF